MSDDEAPVGQVWVCGACGRRARHRSEGGISGGWDSACRTWAVLCWEDSVVLADSGQVIAAKAAIEERR